MKVIRLKTNPNIYSGNSYLLLGEWNTLNDINTLIDTGTDDYILGEISKINTGVGKKPIEQVILTHNHFDHSGGLTALKEKYKLRVFAAQALNGLVDEILSDGRVLRGADNYLEIILSPGHSSDSICIYCKNEMILFSGDTNLLIRDTTGTYTGDFVNTLQRLSELKLKTVFPGHGDPITEKPEEMIKMSLKNVMRSKLV